VLDVNVRLRFECWGQWWKRDLRGHEEIYLVMIGKVFAQLCALFFAFFGEQRVTDTFALPCHVVEAFGMADKVEDWRH
jgi:hypothetical protein